MCGVFGFISSNDKKPNMKRLREIAKATESRGRHAFGFAWIDQRDRLRSFKQEGRISDSMALLEMAADARMLIGHCRFATDGDPENNINNHPHASDGGWIVHNGCVPTYADLYETHDLWPVTECDSEVIALLIETLDGSLLQRCTRTMRIIGDGDAVVMGLWSGPNRMLVARNGNPLMMGSTPNGTYFASLGIGLPDNAVPVMDGVVSMYSQTKIGEISAKQETIRPAQRRAKSSRKVARGCVF